MTRNPVHAARVEAQIKLNHGDCLREVSVKPASKCTDYIHRLTQGMQAKKYKGGVAAKAKASSNRLFEQYFKPLEDTCQK